VVDNAPSAWRIGEVMRAWQQARNRLLADDPELASDEAELAELLGPEQDDALSILNRLLRAAVRAEDLSVSAVKRAEEIGARAKRFADRSTAMRTAAFHVMEAMDKTRYELPDVTASMRAGQPSVFIINEELLPKDCIRTIPESKEPDKKIIGSRLKALRQWEIDRARALESGLDPETIPDPPPDVPGASLSNGMPTLQLRRK
jgi:Siphovirus Gp157